MNEYTTNQPIGSTATNQPIGSTATNQPIGSTATNQPIGSTATDRHETQFSTGANPPPYQGSQWEHNGDSPDECKHCKDSTGGFCPACCRALNNTGKLTFGNPPTENIYKTLQELQKLISQTESYVIRGDLVRMYNDLLLKI